MQRQRADVHLRIVRAFLDGLPSYDHRAAAVVSETMENNEGLSGDALNALANAFEDALILYTGPNLRTEFKHRDTLAYVRAWQQRALLRKAVGADEYCDGKQLPPVQLKLVFQVYQRQLRKTQASHSPLSTRAQTTTNSNSVEPMLICCLGLHNWNR